MVQPLYKKFASLADKTDPPDKKKPSGFDSAKLKKAFTTIFLLVVAGCAGYYLLSSLPVSTTLGGEYVAPQNIAEIAEFSRARWFMHDTHEGILTACAAWYLKSTESTSGQMSVEELEAAGFLPFIFTDQTGEHVNVLTEMPESDSDDIDFVFVLQNYNRTTTSFLSRRTYVRRSPLGNTQNTRVDETISVNCGAATSFVSQFQPNDPAFSEIYTGFLAQVWEQALIGYIRTYNQPPRSLDDLLDGVGLVINPDNMWPFEEDMEFVARIEGGVVDGEITYWQVTNEDGATGGQARYYDQYTSYDDHETPDLIITAGRSSSVVRPSELSGNFNVMFSLEIYRDMLFEVNPPTDPEDGS